MIKTNHDYSIMTILPSVNFFLVIFNIFFRRSLWLDVGNMHVFFELFLK